MVKEAREKAVLIERHPGTASCLELGKRDIKRLDVDRAASYQAHGGSANKGNETFFRCFAARQDRIVVRDVQHRKSRRRRRQSSDRLSGTPREMRRSWRRQ